MAKLSSAGCYPDMNKNHKKSFLRDLPEAVRLRLGCLEGDVRMINFDIFDAQYYIEYYPKKQNNRFYYIQSRMTVIKVRNKSYTGYVVRGEDAEDWLTLLEDKFGVPLRG